MPDGSIKHLHDLARCLRDEAGNEEVVGAIWIFTERRVTEEAIRRSESLSRRSAKNQSHRQLRVQSVIGEMFWSEETFAFLDTTVTPNPPWKRSLNGFIRTTKLWFKGKFTHATSQGKGLQSGISALVARRIPVKYVHVVAHAMKDKAGDLEFVGAVTDITKRKNDRGRPPEQ